MFKNCNLLQSPPQIRANTLAKSCCEGMFSFSDDSTSTNVGLMECPLLDAAKAVEFCYKDMFKNCRSLVRAMEILPLTTLAVSCCESMFKGCINLENPPILPA